LFPLKRSLLCRHLLPAIQLLQLSKALPSPFAVLLCETPSYLVSLGPCNHVTSRGCWGESGETREIRLDRAFLHQQDQFLALLVAPPPPTPHTPAFRIRVWGRLVASGPG